jgi:hypothetical protein
MSVFNFIINTIKFAGNIQEYYLNSICNIEPLK